MLTGREERENSQQDRILRHLSLGMFWFTERLQELGKADLPYKANGAEREEKKKKGGASSCVTFALEQKSGRQVGPGCQSRILTWPGSCFLNFFQASLLQPICGISPPAAAAPAVKPSSQPIGQQFPLLLSLLTPGPLSPSLAPRPWQRAFSAPVEKERREDFI